MSKPTAVEYPGSDMMMTGAVHDISPGAQADTKHTFSDRAEPANIRLVLKSRGDNTTNASTAMPPGANHPTFPSNANGHGYRRSRPQTSHQKAVDINRKMRVEHILHQQLHRVHASIRKRKRRKGTSFVFAAMKRIYELPDGYDTEGERSWGPGGLVPGPGEKEAYGEDALRHKKALDRAIRRLERDDNGASMNGVVREGNPKRKAKQRSGGSDDRQSEPGVGMAGKGEEGYLKQPKSSQIRAEDEAQQHEEGGRGDGLKPEEGLDDLDLDLLGESRDEENGDEDVEDVEDSGLDDTEGEGEGEGSSE